MNATTTCQFPSFPATVKTYKSQRAATLAVSKAEKAYEVARRNCCTDEYHEAKLGFDDLFARVNEYIGKAYENLEATVNAARDQGFHVRSRHVDPNPTRDLISSNID